MVAGGPSDAGARSTGDQATSPGRASSTDNTPIIARTTSSSTGATAKSGGSFSGSSVTRPSGTTTSGGTAGLVVDDMAALSGSQIDMSPVVRAGLPSGESPGTWYSFTSDLSTSVVPNQNLPFFFTTVRPPPGVASTRAACLTSPGFVGFYAGEGFNFAVTAGATADAGQMVPTAVAAPFDARSYSGVKFWAIAIPDAGPPPPLKIAFPDDQTSGAVASSTCNVDLRAGQAGQCDDDFADQAEALSFTWEQFTIPFSTLTQGGYGGVAGTFVSWDAAHVYAMNFQVNGMQPDAGPNPAFGLCIADIEFTR
jgi:hypothetical protein